MALVMSWEGSPQVESSIFTPVVATASQPTAALAALSFSCSVIIKYTAYNYKTRYCLYTLQKVSDVSARGGFRGGGGGGG